MHLSTIFVLASSALRVSCAGAPPINSGDRTTQESIPQLVSHDGVANKTSGNPIHASQGGDVTHYNNLAARGSVVDIDRNEGFKKTIDQQKREITNLRKQLNQLIEEKDEKIGHYEQMQDDANLLNKALERCKEIAQATNQKLAGVKDELAQTKAQLKKEEKFADSLQAKLREPRISSRDYNALKQDLKAATSDAKRYHADLLTAQKNEEKCQSALHKEYLLSEENAKKANSRLEELEQCEADLDRYKSRPPTSSSSRPRQSAPRPPTQSFQRTNSHSVPRPRRYSTSQYQDPRYG